jgi:hypothetical protein
VKIQSLPILTMTVINLSYILIVSVSDAFPPGSSRADDGVLCNPSLGATGCTLHLQLHVLMQVRGRRHAGYPLHDP